MIPLDGIESIVVAFSLSKIGTVRALIFSLDLSESFSLDARPYLYANTGVPTLLTVTALNVVTPTAELTTYEPKLCSFVSTIVKLLPAAKP